MNRISRNLGSLTMFAVMAAAASIGFAQTPSQKDALKAATDRANAIKAATGAKPATDKMPPGDPCTVVTLASVQNLVPGAKAGVDEHRIEGILGTKECQWKNAAGGVLMLLQDTYNSGTSAKEDATGWAELAAGEKGKKNVRIETFSSVGVDNGAFVEAADAARGIPNNFAHLELRKGKHNITIGAPGVVIKDRAQTLKALEALAREAATRM